MSITPAPSAERTIVDELTAFVTQTRDVVQQLAQTTQAALAASTPKRAALREVEPLVGRLLGEREDIVHGAGYVAAPGVLADAPWWLEWFAWDSGRVQRLVPETNPEGAHFFDYTLMPWYSSPLDTGESTITGPYVDYLCTDDYTLTFTQPVLLPDGTFAGVVGADVRVIAVEDRFLKLLRSSDRLLAVVNRLGRVVLSNSARLLSGDLVDEVDVVDLWGGADPRLQVVDHSELALLDLGQR